MKKIEIFLSFFLHYIYVLKNSDTQSQNLVFLFWVLALYSESNSKYKGTLFLPIMIPWVAPYIFYGIAKDSESLNNHFISLKLRKYHVNDEIF